MTQNKYFSYNDGVSYTHLFKKENAFIAPNKGTRIRSFFMRELHCIRRLNKNNCRQAFIHRCALY